MKTIFIPVYDTTEITPLLKKSLAFMKDETSAAFFTTVQFINQLPLIKKFYKKHNIKIEFLSSIKKTSQQGISSKFSSQILGCDATAAKKAKSNLLIYLGSGYFHPIALFLNSEKKILQINPETGKVEFFDSKNIKSFLAKKAARLQKLKDAKKIGIWVTTKPGQYNEKLALIIKKNLEKQGKEVFLFISDTVSPTDMINFRDIEVWVNTACPRIIEDQNIFPKPIINAEEI